MNRINPFENYFDPNKIGNAGNVGAPKEIDGQNQPEETGETQGISGVEQTQEDDFVDTSNMVDDSGDFNPRDFGGEGASQGNDDDLEKASELMSDFLNQRRN